MVKFSLSIVVFIAIFLKSDFVFSQIQNFKGVVLDAATNLPVPFASILQLKTSNGTVSNAKGEFSLALKKTGELSIRITSIGYKTSFEKIKFTKDKTIIFLIPDETQLQEVIIMPDSLLKSILSRAYQRISANYYQSSIELTGFYREVRKSKEGRFLYFGEAILKVQQKGYQYPQESAQVEVLKARITNFPNSDSIDNVKYYNGPFIANWGDFVKTRALFLNPRSFNREYIYKLESITNYNDKKDTVYVITFRSKNSAEKKNGKIWINKKTFAYLKIEFENGLEYRQNPIIPVKFLYRKYQTLYSEDSSIYFLKYASMSGESLNMKTKKISIPLMEFVTTSYDIGNKIISIPVEKRLDYLSVFSMQKNNYDENFWESYTSIEKDSSLKNQIQLYYSAQESKLINQPKIPNNTPLIPKKYERKKKMLQIAQRIHGGYGLSINYYQPFKEESLQLIYQQTSVNNINYKPSHQFFPTYVTYSGFDLNKKWSIQTRTTRSLLKENYFYSMQLNFKHSYLVKKMGNPLVLNMLFGITSVRTGFYLGDIVSNNVIELDGQNLGYKTKAYLGEKSFNGVLGGELDYKKRRKHYFLTVQYSPIVRRENALFFKTKKNIFSTKNALVTDFSDKVNLQPKDTYKGVGSFSITVGIGF